MTNGRAGTLEGESLSYLLAPPKEEAQTLPSQGLLLCGNRLPSSSLLALCLEYSVTMDSPLLTAASSDTCVLLFSSPEPYHLGACAMSLGMAGPMAGTEKKVCKRCRPLSREFEGAHCQDDPASFPWPTAFQPNWSSCFSDTQSPAWLFPLWMLHMVISVALSRGRLCTRGDIR